MKARNSGTPLPILFLFARIGSKDSGEQVRQIKDNRGKDNVQDYIRCKVCHDSTF
jgi:hypothetical protein